MFVLHISAIRHAGSKLVPRTPESAVVVLQLHIFLLSVAQLHISVSVMAGWTVSKQLACSNFRTEEILASSRSVLLTAIRNKEEARQCCW